MPRSPHVADAARSSDTGARRPRSFHVRQRIGSAKDTRAEVGGMILLFHPRSTKPKNRRLPLSVLYLGAVLEGREEYEIVDGNADPDPWASIDGLMQQNRVELFGVSVMPGPQLLQAVEVCRAFREKYPRVPIVWGGYFASLYTEASLNARYVDFVV